MQEQNRPTLSARDIIQRFRAFEDPQRRAGWRADCPVHERDAGHNPSLIIDFTEQGRVLLHCHRCDTPDIVRAVGLTLADLDRVSDYTDYISASTAPADRPLAGPSAIARANQEAAKESAALDRAVRAELAAAKRTEDGLQLDPETEPVAHFMSERFGIDVEAWLRNEAALRLGLDGDYLIIQAFDASGNYAYSQGRAIDPENERRWLTKPNPSDDERWAAAGYVGRVDGRRPVVVTEGLSDALQIAALDLYDVLAVRGAKLAARVAQEAGESVRGRRVYVAGDADADGEAFQLTVAAGLAGIASTVHTIELPRRLRDRTPKADIGDFYKWNPDDRPFAERLDALLSEAPAYLPEPLEFNYNEFLAGGADDVDRAEALRAYIREGGGDIAWTAAFGFALYDGSIWVPNAEGKIKQYAFRLGARIKADAAALYEEANRLDEEGNTEQFKRVKKRADALQRNGTSLRRATSLTGVLAVLPSLAGVEREANVFDADRNLLGVGNGVVDLRTGKLRPVRKSDYLTKRTHINYVPGAFERSTRFRQFLAEVLVDSSGKPNPELVEFMRVLYGYGITGHTSEEVCVFMTGAGGNGKSKLLSALAHAVGPYAQTTRVSTFEENAAASAHGANALATLKGARLLFAQEADKPLSPTQLKTTTGGDSQNARLLYQRGEFEFTPEFLLSITMNQDQRLRGQDEGLWRRILKVPFNASFTDAGGNREKDLSEKLEGDAEAILDWLVSGAVSWFEAGRKLPPCRIVAEASRDLRRRSDQLDPFITENIRVTGNPKDRLFLKDLRARYRAYTQHYSVQTFNDSLSDAITERLAGRGVVRPTNAHVQHWLGARLMSPEEIVMQNTFDRLEDEGYPVPDREHADADALIAFAESCPRTPDVYRDAVLDLESWLMEPSAVMAHGTKALKAQVEQAYRRDEDNHYAAPRETLEVLESKASTAASSSAPDAGGEVPRKSRIRVFRPGVEG